MEKHELNKKIGEKIVILRTGKGWSQSDLARASLKDRQAIEKLENGKVNPTIYTLFEVAKGLGVELQDLVDFTSIN
ncbi:MAG: helix-turn-helix domain-containing protein [Cytophagales bacterium]|nr:helix-turn-helix domain-containing protein [Cytophagales bacterium]